MPNAFANDLTFFAKLTNASALLTIPAFAKACSTRGRCLSLAQSVPKS
jgi:hypothetical protein